jgi:hypothetical protein
MRSCFFVSTHVRRLEEDNKEEEELVDVARRWGEPRISCVMCFVLYYSFIFLVHYYDRYIYKFLVLMI